MMFCLQNMTYLHGNRYLQAAGQSGSWWNHQHGWWFHQVLLI